MPFEEIPVFDYTEPAQLRVPFLFNSPHSGRIYPQHFLQNIALDSFTIRISEDSYVDLLFKDVIKLGACFMMANYPRSFIDINRRADELDPEMFEDLLPESVPSPSIRVLAGLGTIPKIVATKLNIYNKKLSVSNAIKRIENYYTPYHVKLNQVLLKLKDRFGFSVLIDCHSMPSNLKYFEGKKQPDFILGDHHSRSCASSFTQFAAALLEKKGYQISINQPYSGGFITSHYGAPFNNIHTLQIEINRSLYLNEMTLEIHQGFQQLRQDLMTFCADLMSFPEDELMTYQSAAE
ncbi:N-formylglutamate amidohydrolase [Bartonella tamiae]|uniref:N-formylglutamate amidohydrolase n=1 Tax=Bartonella tamiae Th239 TaxID=1094558 RepID=J0QZW6_9HYPH|nr:N-formylglutamate amidohydrolase [Bartonella tamiae]EJF88799.1 hypothetical protein ME5_01350 [Bartonella tamiae Th239]EJF94951.1 hypothetical protein MEG_00532 [Bartonella tamiae Th307]